MHRLIIALLLLTSGLCYGQQDPSIACSRELAIDPRFAPIASKLPLTAIEDMKFEMLANETLANNAERKAIAGWVDGHKECGRVGEEYRKSHYPPQIVALVIETDNRVIEVAVNLYNRKLTYGAANKRLQATMDDMRNKVAAIVQQIQDQRAAQALAAKQAQDSQQEAQKSQQAGRERDESAQLAAQQRDEANRQAAQAQAEQDRQAQMDAVRRQAAIQMLLNNTRPYQLPMPTMPRQPVQTNCTQFGNSVNCTTR